MKNKTRKILDFLLQDVHFKHNYFLVGGILLFLTLVGATSYALFSYEVYSTRSIHIAFNDTEKPVCVIEGPADNILNAYETTTYTMTCTDDSGVSDTTLTSSNFTITGGLTIESVIKEKINKGYKYTISVSATETGGNANIQLKSNLIQDIFENYNEVSNVSGSILVIETILCDAMEEETSNANMPSLASNMIPVCYNSKAGTWIKADSTNTNEDYRWYSYSGKTWANAITVTESNRQAYLDAEVGTKISMDDINTMWVWIPRFSATMNGEYNGATEFTCSFGYYTKDACIKNGYVWNALNPGAFDITFVNTSTTAHDAFTFDNKKLSGMWVGKFENSSDIECISSSKSALDEGCNLTTIRPKILPHEKIWYGAMVSTFFYDIYYMSNHGNQYGFVSEEVNTHMMKNSEWGAVAYLTQSIYGRCTSSTNCTEIGINNYNQLFTGYGVSANAFDEDYSWDYIYGEASTTGNIYGIYDMSGGSEEYVMGLYWDGTRLWSGSNETYHSGFSGCLGLNCSHLTSSLVVSYPDSEYYNTYINTGTDSSPVTDYTSNKQHALLETAGWYNDYAYFVTEFEPWFVRGGRDENHKYSGIFSYRYSSGGCGTTYGTTSYESGGSRSTLIVDF